MNDSLAEGVRKRRSLLTVDKSPETRLIEKLGLPPLGECAGHKHPLQGSSDEFESRILHHAYKYCLMMSDS